MQRNERDETSAPDGGEIPYTVMNTSCVNKSPLEFVPDDPETVALITKVEEAMDDKSVTCASVLNQDKANALWLKLTMAGHNVATAKASWESIKALPVMDVLTGSDFTKKRLASMPDRKTNGDRPAMTTAADVGDFATWWPNKYLTFWFEGDAPAVKRLGILEYDTLTPAEKEASVSLQIMAISLFDCALMHFVNRASPDGELLRIKASRATDHINNVLVAVTKIATASSEQILFLQEVTTEAAELLESMLPDHQFMRNVAAGDQMSVLGVPKTWSVVQENVAPLLQKWVDFDDQAVAAAVFLTDTGHLVLAASVHADTDGTISVPIIEAIVGFRNEMLTACRILIGIDANTAAKGKGAKLSLATFMEAVRSSGLTTCHGDTPDPAVHYTSKKRRSVLQTQLSKAVSVRDPAAGYEQEVKLFLITDNTDGTRVHNTRMYSDGGASCPNPWCPCDHFPQVGVVAFEQTRS